MTETSKPKTSSKKGEGNKRKGFYINPKKETIEYFEKRAEIEYREKDRLIEMILDRICEDDSREGYEVDKAQKEEAEIPTRQDGSPI